MLKANIILFSAIFIVIGYLLYVPLPDDIEERWKIKIILTPLQIIKGIISLVGTTGFKVSPALLQTLFRRNLSVPDSDKVKITGTEFDGVRVHLYEPKEKGGRLRRGFIYLHGGGWVLNNMENTHLWTELLAYRLDMVVVSVDYRLAPENIYPVPFEDCVTASKYFLKNSLQYGVDGNRVAIGGDSAGGNLAAAVSLKLRDIDFVPALKIQVPIVPVLQAFDFDTSSYQAYGHTPILTRRYMVYFWLLYLFGDLQYYSYMTSNHSNHLAQTEYAKHVNQALLPENYRKKRVQSTSSFVNEEINAKLMPLITDPYVAPLAAEDLSGLPKTYMITAEYDVLRDDALFYITKLLKAGNDVTHKSYKTIHSFAYAMGSPFYLKSGIECFEDLCKYLELNL